MKFDAAAAPRATAHPATATADHRTLSNAVYNVLPWAVSGALGIIFTPYIVRGFGADAYGILSLLSAIVGYLAFLDLNLSQAVVKYVAEYNAAGDNEGVNQVIGTTILLFLVIGTAAGAALILTSHALVVRFLKIDPQFRQTANLAISIAAFGFVASLLLSAATGILNGLNRFDITSKITIVSGILISLGSVTCVKFSLGIEWVLALNVAASFLGAAALILVALRLNPRLSCRPHLSRNMAKRLMRFGGYTILSRISYLISFQGDRIAAGVLLGSSYVTFYAVPVTLIQRIFDSISRMAYVTYPVFSDLNGRKKPEQIKELYLNGSRLIITAATAGVLPLLIYGNDFLAAWMGADFERNTASIMRLWAIALYLNIMTQMPTLALQALGHVRVTAFFSLFSACLNLALIYPLTSIMKLNGIAASFLISQLITLPLFLIIANRRMAAVSLTLLLKRAFLKPVALGLLWGLLIQLLPAHPIHNIFLLLAVMALTGVLYLASALCTGVFTPDECRAANSYLRRLAL